MTKLFLRKNGCAPCNRVKEAIDIEKFKNSGAEIIFLDEVSSDELQNYKTEFKLRTVPTYVSDTLTIADSQRIIDLLKPGYGK